MLPYHFNQENTEVTFYKPTTVTEFLMLMAQLIQMSLKPQLNKNLN